MHFSWKEGTKFDFVKMNMKKRSPTPTASENLSVLGCPARRNYIKFFSMPHIENILKITDLCKLFSVKLGVLMPNKSCYLVLLLHQEH